MRAHKFGAKNCSAIDPTCGRHASLKEHRRYHELKLMERAGEIRNLAEQVPIQVAPAVVIDGRKRPAVRYVADFCYEEHRPQAPFRGWQQVIEDCKGVQTPVFRLKRHLLAAKGVEVRLS